ncbi:MAG: phosphatidate cytidylyltransferase [Armatimonadota bacterium]|nr:phosphatidate cytidylyltransferase [Armatimonadota bacterium]MDR5697743.1 phosphatidate cytidylyltransferase [Armatimonadota bacterium]
MLTRRLLTAMVGVPLAVAGIWVGGWFFAALVCMVVAFGTWEFYALMNRAGYVPSREAGMVAAVAFVVLAHVGEHRWIPTLLAGLLLYALSAQLAERRGRALPNAAGTALGALYVGYFAAHLLLLRRLPDGVALTLLVLGAVWVGDSAAYFVGRRIGRRKLLPEVSPAKTIEGAVGGLGGALVAALGVGWAAGLPAAFAVVGGLACGVASQVGDLWESAIKREARVKDSGNLLPGHGGFLDRFDGLLFAGVIAYYAFGLWTGAI